MAKVLIITVTKDMHAHAVAWALEQMGHSVVTWVATDYPEAQTISLAVTDAGTSLSIEGVAGAGHDGFDAVWFRRFPRTANISRIDPADMKFANREVVSVLEATSEALAPSAFWVNPLWPPGLQTESPTSCSRRWRVA